MNAGAYLLFWEKVGEKLWLGAVVEKGGGYKREVCKAIIAMGFKPIAMWEKALDACSGRKMIWALPAARAFRYNSSFVPIEGLIPGFSLQSLTRTSGLITISSYTPQNPNALLPYYRVAWRCDWFGALTSIRAANP